LRAPAALASNTASSSSSPSAPFPPPLPVLPLPLPLPLLVLRGRRMRRVVGSKVANNMFSASTPAMNTTHKNDTVSESQQAKEHTTHTSSTSLHAPRWSPRPIIALDRKALPPGSLQRLTHLRGTGGSTGSTCPRWCSPPRRRPAGPGGRGSCGAAHVACPATRSRAAMYKEEG